MNDNTNGGILMDVSLILQAPEGVAMPKHCPRILSLDGGGVRGLSSLLILRELMEEIGRRTHSAETPLPCQYFDLMGGTSTGGLIAIMLGRLRMVFSFAKANWQSIHECIQEYIDLSSKVFDIDQVLGGVIPFGDDACRFNYKHLEDAIRAVVKKKLGDKNALMVDTSNRANMVPTFVVATKGLRAEGPPTLFRSYQCEGHNASECAIWEAARATSAAPTFFKPIKITVPLPGATYVDGGLAHNNPSELALSEAEKNWTNTRKFYLVSIRTGRLESVSVLQSQSTSASKRSRTAKVHRWMPYTRKVGKVTAGITAIMNIGEACVQLATNSEFVHQRLFLLSISNDPGKRFPYHRFNVDQGMKDVKLQEWEKLEDIAVHTTAYMEEGEGIKRKNECVQYLTNPPLIESK
jgi:patatin-like phospholipase/acyl hydrolase